MDDRSDEILVIASRQGDKSAYAILVERHYRYVFAICLGILASIHDAEDIAQDAMLKGLLKITDLRETEQFKCWILQIAKNLCIDFLRRRKRVKDVRLSSVEALVADEYPTQTKKTTNDNHDLHRAIKRLPKELRIPLVMYYFDNKNAKAIAERLNISHSGACQRIRTARQQLHELLTGRL